jgi:hypothetical protein
MPSEEVIRRPGLRREESVVAGILHFIREKAYGLGLRKPPELVPTRTTISFLNVRKRLGRTI